MALSETIYKLRTDAKMSREKFAEIFGVSAQAVYKWENGAAQPELNNLVKIAKYFDVSTDALLLGGNTRILEELGYTRKFNPRFANIHTWEAYYANLPTEYRQCAEEGLDVEAYREVFASAAKLPNGKIKKKLGDVLFEAVSNLPMRVDYKYVEPNGLNEIKALSRGTDAKRDLPSFDILEDKIYGAWTGRICGCLLGKTVEGMRTDELIPLLKETENYPMTRYIRKSEITEEMCDKYRFRLKGRKYADDIDGMPADDDTNYVVMAQKLIEQYGCEFTPYDVSRIWLALQPKDAYCTAERVAFCNFVNGYEPPQSAMYKNPYREWIGAQIRADYYGYINPCNPEKAAETAHKDASISHVKNGIYGAMFVAAMIASAAATDEIEEITESGLSVIPRTSRLYEAVEVLINDYRSGVKQCDAFKKIHERFDEFSEHDWCHTIPNALIVTAALLYGGGDFGKSICLAVQTGFDTDCNGATVGSVLGMRNGRKSIGDEWTDPIKDKLHTSIFGAELLSIRECVQKTMEHLK